MGKFGPAASNFGYDFWAENCLTRGSELGPKVIFSIDIKNTISKRWRLYRAMHCLLNFQLL